MTTGEKIKALRLRKGWTQQELATKLEFKSKTSVAHIEQNRDRPINIIENAAKLLGTTPAYLMGWERDPEKKMYLFQSIDDITDEQFESLISYFEELRSKNEPPVV